MVAVNVDNFVRAESDLMSPKSIGRLPISMISTPSIRSTGPTRITELVMHYDAQPFFVVSIMEFEDVEVVQVTQYFTEAFEPGASRAQWVELMSPGEQG